MENPSNTEAANRADPVTYWRQGRAICLQCGAVGVYVARVEVKDLVCDCGAVRVPRHEVEGER